MFKIKVLSDGKPATHGGVTIWKILRIGDDGIVITDLPAGKYVIVADAYDEYPQSFKRVDVKDGETVEIDLAKDAISASG